MIFESEKELADFVGRSADSLPIAIDQKMINTFGELTRDRQWIHVDIARAQVESPYKTTIAHGLLTLAMLPAWYEEVISLPNRKMSLNYGFDRVRFTGPVPSGASLFGRFTLVKAEELNPGELRLTWDVEVRSKDLERPAIVARWITQVAH